MHYQRWKAHGDPGHSGRERRPRGSEPLTCTVEGCSRFVTARSYCDKHYRRWLHNGAPDAFAPKSPPTDRQLAALAAGRITPKRVFSDEERIVRHRDATRAWARRWRQQNPDAAREVRRAQMSSYGPDYRRKWNHYNRLRRRAAITAGVKTCEYDEYIAVLVGDPCCYCGVPMAHIDHIQPIARGGSGTWDNLTASCAKCNFSKHDRSLLQFLLAQST